MKFTELEQIMSDKGVNSLAEIARTLKTTPQAVSNWKARNQVPFHIVAKITKKTRMSSAYSNPVVNYNSSNGLEEETVNLSDILLTITEQLKIILLVPFITVFLTFTYLKFIQSPIYESSSTILLPATKAGMGGLAGLASQFGVSVPQAQEAGLSSPSLLPDLIGSRVFAERILDKTFYIEQYDQEIPLLAILTYGVGVPEFERDTLMQEAIGIFQGMVKFVTKGSFSVLTITAAEPQFARDLNKIVLSELQELHRYFKNQHVNEKIDFIDKRIKAVKNDLEQSEQTLKSFRQQNRQVSSPALQLQLERLTRDIEVEKGIYLTLKQQLELAKIEEVQETSVIQVLYGPQIPLFSAGVNLKLSVLIAGLLGLGSAIALGFIRSYFSSGDIDERRKFRRMKNFLKKKSKDVILDRRISGIVSILFILCSPFYLGHKSQSPVFFGRYSATLMLFNTVYILILLIFISVFIFVTFQKTNMKKIK